jgi:hypothetical protein
MQKINRELEGYIEWIFAAEDVILQEERTTDEERVTIMEGRQRNLALLHGLVNKSL